MIHLLTLITLMTHTYSDICPHQHDQNLYGTANVEQNVCWERKNFGLVYVFCPWVRPWGENHCDKPLHGSCHHNKSIQKRQTKHRIQYINEVASMHDVPSHFAKFPVTCTTRIWNSYRLFV